MGIVIWTAVFIFCMRGTVNALEARGVSRVLGTTIAYVIAIAVLLLIGLLMSSPLFGIGDQFNDLVSNMPGYIASISDFANDFANQHPDIVQNPAIAQAVSDAASSLSTWADSAIKAGMSSLADTVTITANSFICIGFAAVVAFWLLMDLPAIGAECTRLLGEKHADDMHFLHVTFSRVVDGYIKGTLLQCGLIAVGCVVAFSILGIPNAVAFGIIAGLLNLIPVVGPWLGAIVAGVAALFVSPWAGLLALIITALWQQIIFTFISPKIMANSVDVHPVLVVFAMMIGMAAGAAMSGFVGSLVGMLISIPAAAVGKAVFVYYFEKRTGRHLIDEHGVFFKGVPSTEGGTAPDPEADATSPHPLSMGARVKADARRATLKAQTATARMKRSQVGKRGKRGKR